MRILLVDDEVEMVDALSLVLKREGYQVDLAYEGDRGFQLAQETTYDLLILDWMLPHLSGLAICQKLREQGVTTPVLFLTAKDTTDDRVQGLDAGADDYLIKPFELRELLARVRARLRRPMTGVTAPKRLQVGDLELDSENQRAICRGQAIDLSEKESQLLEYLMRSPNQLLTHEQISQHLWPSSEATPTSNALAALIRLLRRKIERGQASPVISTIYGKGYRFETTDVDRKLTE